MRDRVTHFPQPHPSSSTIPAGVTCTCWGTMLSRWSWSPSFYLLIHPFASSASPSIIHPWHQCSIHVVLLEYQWLFMTRHLPRGELCSGIDQHLCLDQPACESVSHHTILVSCDIVDSFHLDAIWFSSFSSLRSNPSLMLVRRLKLLSMVLYYLSSRPLLNYLPTSTLSSPSETVKDLTSWSSKSGEGNICIFFSLFNLVLN